MFFHLYICSSWGFDWRWLFDKYFCFRFLWCWICIFLSRLYSLFLLWLSYITGQLPLTASFCANPCILSRFLSFIASLWQFFLDQGDRYFLLYVWRTFIWQWILWSFSSWQLFWLLSICFLISLFLLTFCTRCFTKLLFLYFFISSILNSHLWATWLHVFLLSCTIMAGKGIIFKVGNFSLEIWNIVRHCNLGF